MSRYTNASRSTCSRTFPSVYRYDNERVWGPQRDSLHNFLVRQCSFPSEIRRGEHVAEFWPHLIDPLLWMEAVDKLKSKNGNGMLLLDDTTDASFLAMCQKLVGKEFKVTGGIAVAFPGFGRRKNIFRLTVVGLYREGRKLYNDNDGPHVLHEDDAEPGRKCMPPAWGAITGTMREIPPLHCTGCATAALINCTPLTSLYA